MTRRTSISLSAPDEAVLRQLYVLKNIPTDQYKRRPQEVNQFLREWVAFTGRTDTWEDLCHYMVTRRKRGLWPQLGPTHRRLACPDWDTLSDEEWDHLEAVYTELLLADELASDELLYSDTLSAHVAREFRRRSGRTLDGRLLTGLILSKRKRGEWVRQAQPNEEVRDAGWGDLNQVG